MIVRRSYKHFAPDGAKQPDALRYGCIEPQILSPNPNYPIGKI
ncbi:MAG: hypothetical protein QOK48_3042 [Blastocatellia bacterium]|jgi:hypothetical protein|nr:hypothetical protein [Blastocatellia bacterium]